MPRKFCIYCGNKLRENTKYCIFCGKRIANIEKESLNENIIYEEKEKDVNAVETEFVPINESKEKNQLPIENDTIEEISKVADEKSFDDQFTEAYDMTLTSRTSKEKENNSQIEQKNEIKLNSQKDKYFISSNLQSLFIIFVIFLLTFPILFCGYADVILCSEDYYSNIWFNYRYFFVFLPVFWLSFVILFILSFSLKKKLTIFEFIFSFISLFYFVILLAFTLNLGLLKYDMRELPWGDIQILDDNDVLSKKLLFFSVLTAIILSAMNVVLKAIKLRKNKQTA